MDPDMQPNQLPTLLTSNQLIHEAIQNWVNGKTHYLPMSATPETAQILESHKRKIVPLLKELLQLSLDQGYELNDDREGYLGAQKRRARAIGERFHAIGGLELMQTIASAVPPYDVRSLDYAWDGVGTWSA